VSAKLPRFACKFGLCHYGNTLTTEIFVAGDRRTGEVASRAGREKIKGSETGLFRFLKHLCQFNRLHRVLTAHVDAGWCRRRDECNSTADSLYHFQASSKPSGWLGCVRQRPYREDIVIRNFAVTGDIGTARLGERGRHRQPHAIVRKHPSPEPTISARAILLAQGVPENLPIYFRDLHIAPLLADLLLIHFGHLFGISPLVTAERAQALLKPGSPRPIPILYRKPISVVVGVVCSALSKDQFPRIHCPSSSN
jgi:hypothetical protein